MNQVYILLGSNIDPEKNIPLALKYLEDSPECAIVKISGTWRTKPVGSCCTDFLNTAILIETSLDPSKLKNHLKSLETTMGRVRTEDKNAPRVIDLDIIAVNDRIIDPEVEVFDHLLLPLSEVAPGLILPGTTRKLVEIAAERLISTAAIRVD